MKDEIESKSVRPRQVSASHSRVSVRARVEKRHADALAAIHEARAFQAALLAGRGGVPFPDSVALINEAREERGRLIVDRC